MSFFSKIFGSDKSPDQKTTAPRDYLQEASDMLFGDGALLSTTLETDPDKVVGNLLRIIHQSQGNEQGMARKLAAYALGQIGEPRSVKQLREFFGDDTSPAVESAMSAALTAVKAAPAPDHTELERRQIMRDVYSGKRAPDWS